MRTVKIWNIYPEKSSLLHLVVQVKTYHLAWHFLDHVLAKMTLHWWPLVQAAVYCIHIVDNMHFRSILKKGNKRKLVRDKKTHLSKFGQEHMKTNRTIGFDSTNGLFSWRSRCWMVWKSSQCGRNVNVLRGLKNICQHQKNMIACIRDPKMHTQYTYICLQRNLFIGVHTSASKI